MKFTIHSNVFKNKATRAMQLCYNAAVPILESVVIRAENGVVSFYANNLESDVIISSEDCNIIEEGVAAVHADGIKKLSNMKDYLMFEVTGTSITVSNTKKKMQLACVTDDKEFIPPLTTITDNDEPIATVSDFSELLNVLDILKVSLTVSESKPLYNGFHFNPMGFIETISGYHALRKRVDWFNANADKDFVLNGAILKELKKIIDKKPTDRKISIYKNPRHAVFCGDDFKYSYRLTEGKWLDLDLMLNANYRYTLKPNADEFLDVVKEYKSYNTKKATAPMKITTQDNSIITYYRSNLIKTADKVYNDSKVSDDIVIEIGFDPSYMFDIISAFNKFNENYTISGDNAISPWKFTGDSLFGLVVPMRLEHKDFTDVRSFANGLVA